jgi:hypothetical protein
MDFTYDEGVEFDLGAAVRQALGAASVWSWSESPQGIFEEGKVNEIADALVAEIQAHDEPLLGLARTAALLTEIETRCQIGGEMWLAQKAQDLRSMMTPDQLAYRTVDGG